MENEELDFWSSGAFRYCSAATLWQRTKEDVPRFVAEIRRLQEEVAELKFNLAGTIGARDSGWKACEDARAIARAILDMAQERTGTQFVSDHVLNSHHWLRRT